MSDTDTNEIALAVAALVRDNYVFPDHASTLSGLITSRALAGEYGAFDDVVALAAALTTDLQSVNGDRHLRVVHQDDPVVDLEDDDAALAEWRERAEKDAGGIAAELLANNIGLVTIRPVLYPAEFVGERVAAAMSAVANAAALIIDVRNCRGGSPETVALICSYLFDAEPVHLNTLVDRSGAEVERSFTLATVPGRRFGPDKRVIVLTSGITFSGGEELSYDLQQLGRATVVGEQTGGGAHPRIGFRVHDHLEATIPVARAVNPISGSNWELVGVTPDVRTSADEALERALELLTS